MAIDNHVCAIDLLSQIANSMYDRENGVQLPFAFSALEIEVVEHWLNNYLAEIKKPAINGLT